MADHDEGEVPGVGAGERAERGGDRGAGQIQHTQLTIARIEQIIHQGRGSAAHVDDGGRRRGSMPGDQLQGFLGMLLEPADLGGSLAGVDIFPM